MTPQTQPSGERPAPAPAPAGTELEAARVRVPGNYSLPEMTLQFRRETINNWRMDIPDSVDARKLHDNLLHHLNHVWEAKDRWPDDVNEAYRFVSQHVFAALYDQRMTGGGENQQR